MKARVALAAARSFLSLGPDAPLLPALSAAGYEAEPVAWDGDVDWGRYDAVVVRATWDYTDRLAEFLAWVDRVARATTLANPAPVLRWNTDKRYLADLARAGIPVVPTRWIGPGDAVVLPDDLDDYVVKPAVSIGSRHSARFARGDEARAVALVHRLQGEGRWAMVQPYMRRVDAQGETGVVVLDGEVSHAIRKGGVLVQGAPFDEGYALGLGQRIEPAVAAQDERELAMRTLDAVPGGARSLLYARVDMVRDDAGAPVLLELEVVEPAFFVTTSPGAAERFCRALDRWLDCRRASSCP
jgi:glutathione synthase/RimK-type ligase-like ATP-grasp enzyme